MSDRRLMRVGSWVLAFGAFGVLCAAWGLYAQTAATPAAKEARAPAGFKAKPGTAAEPYSKTGWAKEIIHDKTGVEMVFIPAGEFMTGGPPRKENRFENEGPVYRVRITKAFYMGKYEVTQGEWEKVMGNNPSHFKGSARLPVETVSWDDCQQFLRKAGNGLRLPREGEWEYACRAGTRTRFSFGDDDSDLGDYGWYSANSGDKTHDVGQKKPNAFGLYDMHGNVLEWCSDWYGAYGGGDAVDPTGAAEGADRVLRGGCWYHAPSGCRPAIRFRSAPDYRGGHLGFRVSLDLK